MATTINDVRFSYCNLFEARPPFNNPNGEPKYSVTILVPKSNVTAKATIDAAINEAINLGVSKSWGGVRPPQPKICVHDGDGVRPTDGQPYGPECKGCWVFTASSKQAPFVVNSNVQPIIDPRQVYSGMWGNVSVNFFPYSNSGNKGIGCGLNGAQKTRDDEPLTDYVTAEDAFSAILAGGAMPATPGYSAPSYTAPVPTAPAPGYGYPAAPTYPQQPAAPVPGYGAPAPAPGYPQQPAPYVDPITGQPYTPTGTPIMGL
jgi:hypothetical protein